MLRCRDLVKRHEETIHADRRRGLGRAVQLPVQVPTPPSDEGSHIDSAEYSLQYLDLEVPYANEVHLSPPLDSASATRMEHEFGTMYTQQSRDVPDYAIDPALDLFQFGMTYTDVPGLLPQPYRLSSQEQHDQPQMSDSRPAKRMRPNDTPSIHPWTIDTADIDPEIQNVKPLEQTFSETFAVTAGDWQYPCLNIGDFTGQDLSLPTNFG